MHEAPVADSELAKKMTAVVCRAPLLAGHAVEWRQLLGGLTHITYLLYTEAGDKYVVKFLSREMEELRLAIPSESVVQNTQFAGESGVGARVLFSLPDLPAIVIEFLDGKTLSASEVRQPAYIIRIAHAVRRLHKHTPLMATQSDVFSFLDRYLQVVAEHTLVTPDGLLESLPAVRQIQHALSCNGLDATPCNNDLVPANMIDRKSVV